jgi:ankyrin repeat protein
MAVDGKNEAMVRLLVEAGADVSAEAGYPPLSNEDDDDLDSSGEDNEDMTPLDRTAGLGHTAIVHFLLNSGANVERYNGHVRNALHHAAKGGSSAVVRMLIDAGAELELQDVDMRTPLHFAASGGDNYAVVKILIDAGASIDRPDVDGRTPRFWLSPILREARPLQK